MNLSVHKWYHMHNESIVEYIAYMFAYVVDCSRCCWLAVNTSMLLWIGVRLCCCWLGNESFCYVFYTLVFFTLFILNIVSHPLCFMLSTMDVLQILMSDPCCSVLEGGLLELLFAFILFLIFITLFVYDTDHVTSGTRVIMFSKLMLLLLFWSL